MKKIIFLLFSLLALLSSPLYAQNQKMEVQGTLKDSSDLQLVGATVILLQQADSVLKSFTLSNDQGIFKLPSAAPGNYILQITYVGYQNFSEAIILDGKSGNLDMGVIRLAQQTALLDEVVVKAEHVPIRMNKDTIEYNSAAYDTRPHAAVEDLLKKLPGVEVERDGSIRAQGERVQHVYVDGKEFFGDDPQLATKNLPADAVEKVQVYDKKSDMAEFTGIEDGREEKTINLSLKEDKKVGHFGNGHLGYGTMDRYEGKAMINRFGRKLQLSGIGMVNNTNEQGFSLNEYIQFMGGLSKLMSGGGGQLTLNSDELGLPLMSGAGNNGFVRTGAGGFNLNYEFSKNTTLNSSYFYSQIKNDASKETSRLYQLDEQQFASDENSKEFSKSNGHRLNLKLEHKIDSFQRITARANLGYNKGNLSNEANSQTFNTEALLENTGLRAYQSSGTYLKLESSLNYRRRFRRKGRGLFANVSFDINENERAASLRALNSFGLDDPANMFSDSLKQSQEQSNDPVNYEFGLSYVEPIGGRKYLEFNYSRRNFSNESIKNFYELSNGSTTPEFNPALSNHYQIDYIYDLLGMSFRLNRKKYNLSAGFGLQRSQLDGNLFSEALEIKKEFKYLLPSFRWNYEFTTTKNLSLRYQTSIREPSLEQLQPVVDNSDPLNIYIGNENLQPEYNHQLNLQLMTFDQFSSISLMATINGDYTQNKITTDRHIDSLFRQSVQPINVDDAWRLSSYISFSAPLKPLKSTFNIETNLIYNRSLLLLNDVENTNKQLQGSVDVYIENNNTDLIELIIGSRWSATRTRYSIDERLNNTFLNQQYYTDASVNLGKKWTIGSKVNYTRYSKESYGGNRNLLIWNASLSHNFLDNRAQLSLNVFDMLNQNIGINRSSELNYIEEVRVRSLGRYAMLRFTFALSGLGASDSMGGIRLRTR